MTKYEVLTQLSKNKITTKEAYKQIYTTQRIGKKAHFVKIKIKINESKGVSALLKVLFLFPIPLVFVRIAIRIGLKNKSLKDVDIPVEDFIDLISTRNINIDVNAKDEAHVRIKTL